MATRRGTKGSADFDFFQAYTKDLTSEDVQRLFTRDARDAYQFFTRHIDERAFQGLPPIRRLALRTRLVFLGFSCALGFSWTLDCERVLAGGVSR